MKYLITFRSTSTMPWDTPASGARFICSLKPTHSLRSYLQQHSAIFTHRDRAAKKLACMCLQCQLATQSHLKICKDRHPNSLDPAAHPAICHDAANHHVTLHLQTSAVHVVKAPCRSMAGMEKA